MASKLRAQSTVTGPAPKVGGPTFEEVFVRNDAVSLCLLLNRRARTMRVIDFRAGASPAKKLFVRSIARRERIDKVFALVERDECATWGRLGFVREGNIPGFYKRSDAFIMGCVVPALAAEPVPVAPRSQLPESGVFSVGRHTMINVVTQEDDDETSLPPPPLTAAAEKTINHARRLARELGGEPLVPVKLGTLTASEVAKRVAQATREMRAMTGFEAFGRDVDRDDVIAIGRGVQDLVVGAEVQRCYGNAFIELLTAPRDDRERNFAIAAVRASCDRLLAKEVVCAFALTPADHVKLATVFAASGFRRTGLLRHHLRVKAERVDAILWSRKLANADDDD